MTCISTVPLKRVLKQPSIKSSPPFLQQCLCLLFWGAAGGAAPSFPSDRRTLARAQHHGRCPGRSARPGRRGRLQPPALRWRGQQRVGSDREAGEGLLPGGPQGSSTASGASGSPLIQPPLSRVGVGVSRGLGSSCGMLSVLSKCPRTKGNGKSSGDDPTFVQTWESPGSKGMSPCPTGPIEWRL